MHIRRGEKVIEEMYILRRRRHFLMRKPCFVLFCFILVFSLFYGILSYVLYLCFVTLIVLCLCVGHAYILMLLCSIGCMFK